MGGETNLKNLLKEMRPFLNKGDYVFTSIENFDDVPTEDVICKFKEQEGTTLVLKKEVADKLQLPYQFTASWITLKVHSSLEAVGLTATFSSALAEYHISCNVIAGYYHDHIFVDKKDELKALEVLQQLSKNHQ